MSTQTVNISLPRELVKKTDKLARESYRTRSDLIRDLLATQVRKMESWKKLLAYGKRQGKKLGITSEEQVNQIVYEYRHGKKSN